MKSREILDDIERLHYLLCIPAVVSEKILLDLVGDTMCVIDDTDRFVLLSEGRKFLAENSRLINGEWRFLDTRLRYAYIHKGISTHNWNIKKDKELVDRTINVLLSSSKGYLAESFKINKKFFRRNFAKTKKSCYNKNINNKR